MVEQVLLKRITVDSRIFGGKPIIRGRRLAVEHILGMLAAGDTPETIIEGYDWLEMEDIQACLAYAYKLVVHERVEPLIVPIPRHEGFTRCMRVGRCNRGNTICRTRCHLDR